MPRAAPPAGPRFVERPGAIDFAATWNPAPAYAGMKDGAFAGGGVAVGDVTGDGLADVYLSRPSGGGRLFKNEGGFRFTDITQQSGLAADAAWLKASGLTEIAIRSIHAITVPGAIDGWAELLRKFGTMDLSEALKPAIRLAEEGVPVTPRVAADWPEDTPFLEADEGGRVHCLKDGRTPKVGEIMRYPALAQSMRLIAKEGRDAFDRGAIAHFE